MTGTIAQTVSEVRPINAPFFVRDIKAIATHHQEILNGMACPRQHREHAVIKTRNRSDAREMI